MAGIRRVLRPQPGPQTAFLSCGADLALMGGAAYGGKQLRLDEPVPTPDGWSTIGELKVGDQVFDENGSPTTVTHVHPIDPSPECFRIYFKGGAQIEACADHLWLTFTASERAAIKRRDPKERAKRRASRPSRAKSTTSAARLKALAELNAVHAREKKLLPPPTGTVRTTREILDSVRTRRGQANHTIRIAAGMDLPDQVLPLDPYVLGAWLGDGNSSGGVISKPDVEMFEHIRSLGYECRRIPSSECGWRVVGLTSILRSMGLLEDKKIPMAYLRASQAQRLELLRGFMDTDGHADKHGRSEFTTTCPRLGEDFADLVCGLGMRYTYSEGRATLYGRDMGPKYRYRVVAPVNIFRLTRKAERFALEDPSRRWHYIEAIEPGESSPMRCITVAAESGLFQVGRRHIVTHNSWALLLDALRYSTTPGWTGVLLRRNLSDIIRQGGLWEKAKRCYAGTGAKFREGQYHDIRWPSGASLIMRHVDGQNYNDYQGLEYAWFGIDEATHLRWPWIQYLITRMRTACGTKAVMRMTCNPDPDHILAQWVEPYLNDDGTADRSKSGMIRYWAISREDDKLVWGDTREECAERSGRPEPEVKSFSFIAALAEDNPIGLTESPDYLANLAAGGGVNEARLRDGNWKVKTERGGMFARTKWGYVNRPLGPLVRHIRGWDKAATRCTDSNRANPPAFTAGVKLSWDIQGRCYVRRPAICREEPPQVDTLMATTAEADGPGTTQAIRRDPAQAGKVDEVHTRKVLRSSGKCGPIVVMKEVGDKVKKAAPMARDLNEGLCENEVGVETQTMFFILDDGWMAEPYHDGGDAPSTLGALFWSQVNPFFDPDAFKDIVDAMATAYAAKDEIVEVIQQDPIARLEAW